MNKKERREHTRFFTLVTLHWENLGPDWERLLVAHSCDNIYYDLSLVVWRISQDQKKVRITM